MANWNNIQNFLANYVFIILLVSMFAYWLNIAFPKFQLLAKLGNFTTILANILISIILVYRWLDSGYFPLSNLYESLLFLTWCLTIIQLVLEQKIHSQIIGGITSPITMFIVSFSSISLPKDMQKASPLVPALKSNWLMMHVSIMITSYAALILGSLLAILFLVIARGQDIQLKGSSTIMNTNNNKIIITKQLNLLESIDNLSYRIIGLGFPMLTIGIIAGAVWANEAWGTYWSWDPKETWALITWLVFASYLHIRITKAWQGKRPAILASIGFIIVWICFLGVNFLGKGLHSYGWISQ
uniref:Cytochrome c biogenesis protein CcsA n=1 Tax=Boldia erythrosiphon TaxID=74908 RepID=A0A1Y9TLZ0_9RHOD|nr:cytochrome c biogenesis protein [Boldia erythrosiphon]ARO90660.1 cytochrome c biogenesis protein [Boldia erythrosiphon]